MISFIIIGRNIERTIERCLNGVFRFIEAEKIHDSEVIYVDSDSSDRSVELAGKTEALIVGLKGQINAGAGRNAGAQHASGDILFFLDGDMELLPGFMAEVVDGAGQMKYPFCTGYWNEVYHDADWNHRKTELAQLPGSDQFLPVSGGLMVIEKKQWELMGGMDERLIRSQDHDLGLRMNKAGLPVKKLPVVMVDHLTVSYFDGMRIGALFSNPGILSQGILMRKHLTDKAYLKRYFAKTIYALWFLFACGLLFFNYRIGSILLGGYLLVHALRAVKAGGGVKQILGSFVFHTLFSAYAGFGFLFYHPSTPKYSITLSNQKPESQIGVTEVSNDDSTK